MNVQPIKTGMFREGDDLVAFVAAHVPKLREGDILAVTSKIVALAQRRTAGIKDREKIIRAESAWARKTKYVWLTEKDGMILANAGIDESNAGGKLILLPIDPFASAQKLYASLLQNYGIKKLGVLITDSRVTPLRAGVVGIALGYAGFRGLRDYRGKKDLSGRPLRFTQTNVADSLATAAALEMGEGSERQPLALITDAPVVFRKKVDPREVRIPRKDDMYAPLFQRRLGAKML